MTNPPFAPSSTFPTNFDLVYHPQCCATNPPQNFLTTNPQQSLVAHPGATSARNSVVIDFNLDFLILNPENIS